MFLRSTVHGPWSYYYRKDIAMQKKLSVEGMTCQNCVKRVRKIIEKHGGVADVTVSLEAKEAAFSCGDTADVTAIVEAINDFGFTASEKI